MPYVCWGEHYVVFENEMITVFPYRLSVYDLYDSKVRVLGESLKCTSKLHTIG